MCRPRPRGIASEPEPTWRKRSADKPLAPSLPPPPSPLREPRASGEPPIPDGGESSDEAFGPKKPSRLPSFDLPAPQPKPIDETPAPLIGPAAQQGPNLRLTTDQPVSSNSETTPSPDAVWPR